MFVGFIIGEKLRKERGKGNIVGEIYDFYMKIHLFRAVINQIISKNSKNVLI